MSCKLYLLSGGCLAGGLRTDVWSRCLLVSSNNWRRLVENLAADEFIEMSATQCICSLCEVSTTLRVCYVKNVNGRLRLVEIMSVACDKICRVDYAHLGYSVTSFVEPTNFGQIPLLKLSEL